MLPAVWGAPRSGLSSTVHSPAPTRSISPRMAIIASQNSSISSRFLALGGLDHQCADHGEAHGRSMETVVGQTLCDVVDGDAGVLGQPTEVEDALVRDHAVLAGVENREVLVESTRDVVGRRDGGQAGAAQARSSHHPDVGPGDGPEWTHCRTALPRSFLYHRVRAPSGVRAKMASSVSAHRSGRRRVHRRRAECRRSCADSGG